MLDYESAWEGIKDDLAKEENREVEKNLLDFNTNRPVLKDFMSDPSPGMISQSKEEQERFATNYYDTSMNPEKLAYILIGVSRVIFVSLQVALISCCLSRFVVVCQFCVLLSSLSASATSLRLTTDWRRSPTLTRKSGY